MSADHPPFGINSFIPTAYKTKAEAFAKCLQDKLRLLGCPDEPLENGFNHPETPAGNLTKYSEQEIAENVFLQGPLSYKRRSIPETNGKPLTNGKSKGKHVVSVVDRRGFSSDSEDSDPEDVASFKNLEHPRVAELQSSNDRPRIPSNSSMDSTSSWCSCEDEEEEATSNLASQVKGSPPIHNPRLRNFRRKGRDESHKALKVETQNALQDADLFFDFDMECFSPVTVEDAEPETEEYHENDEKNGIVDTGQTVVDEILDVLTPPPSPVFTAVDTTFISSGFGNQNDSKIINKLELGACINTEDVSADAEPPPSVDLLTNGQVESNEYSASEPLRFETTTTENKTLDEYVEKHDIENVLNDNVVENDDSEEGNIAIKSTENVDLAECDIPHKIENEVPVDESVPSKCTVPITDEDSVPSKCTVSVTVDESVPSKCTVVVTDTENIEIDESYLPPPRMKLRRCSSLKTWKTPPGTPGRKKIVRFADALGLDLADVRTFLDEVPKIPNSAYDDLHYELPSVPPAPSSVEKTLIPMFQQPNSLMDFIHRVRNNSVSLESAVLTDVSLMAISGIVRVRNVSFHKTVHVRYTKDSWTTFSDLQATYMPNSSDGFCDNFSFTLYGHTLQIGEKLEFAIRYDCGNGQFWDNNNGANYCFQCMPRSPAPFFPSLGTSPVDTWTKFY